MAGDIVICPIPGGAGPYLEALTWANADNRRSGVPAVVSCGNVRIPWSGACGYAIELTPVTWANVSFRRSDGMKLSGSQARALTWQSITVPQVRALHDESAASTVPTTRTCGGHLVASTAPQVRGGGGLDGMCALMPGTRESRYRSGGTWGMGVPKILSQIPSGGVMPGQGTSRMSPGALDAGYSDLRKRGTSLVRGL